MLQDEVHLHKEQFRLKEQGYQEAHLVPVL
jgi:hypothetical protein